MGIWNFGRPSVSRDGRRLLYTDNREGSTALVLRDLRTGGEQTLTVAHADFRRPTGTLKLHTRNRFPGAALKDHTLSQLQAARKVYAAITSR